MADFGSNNPRIQIKRLVGRERVERRFDSITRTSVFKVYSDIPSGGPSRYTDVPLPDSAIDAFIVNPGAAGEAPLVIGTPHPNDPLVFARSFRIQEDPGKRGVWDVEWEFSTPDGGGIIDPPQTGFVQVNVDNEVQFQDFFKQDATVPPQGDAPLPIEAITDGEDIAVDGRPTSLPVRTIRADVSIVLDGWPPFALYAVVTGTRNNSEFLGATRGSLLYTGARSNRISENQWQVTHSFVQDQFFHCRQIGKFNDVGDLIEAYWVQPFEEGNFAFLGLPLL